MAGMALSTSAPEEGLVARVQRLRDPRSGKASYTVLGDDGRPIEPLDRFLAHLSAIGRSPNTVSAYAYDLVLLWRFLARKGIAWDAPPSLEELGAFTAWLGSPGDNVIVLDPNQKVRDGKTINRALTATAMFYEFHARHGVDAADALTSKLRSYQGGFRPFLTGIARVQNFRRPIQVAEAPSQPKLLTLTQVAAIIQSQPRYRDQLAFALMGEVGLRVGQVLGLRHSDFDVVGRTVNVYARDDNANDARSKGIVDDEPIGSLPISRDLVRLHADYMHEEYGHLDSDYLFVNVWGGVIGQPMTYAALMDVVRRTRRRVGFYFKPHMLRHTFATEARRRGVSTDMLGRLLTHRDPRSARVYEHLTADDLRRVLRDAGILDTVEDLL